MESKMATKRAIDGIQPDMVEAYILFFSFQKYVITTPIMMYFSHTIDII